MIFSLHSHFQKSMDMGPAITLRGLSNRSLLVKLAMFVCALLGVLALVGWLINLRFLASFSATHIPMAPSTALLFILFSSLVVVQQQGVLSRKRRLMAQLATLAGLVMAAVLLVLSWRGHHPPLENIGLITEVMENGTPLGHMSPLTAALFVVSGIAVLLLHLVHHARRGWYSFPALVLSLLVFMGAFYLVLAYLLGSPFFYTSARIPPALTTSLGFFVLGGGLTAAFLRREWVFPTNIERSGLSGLGILMLVFFFLASSIVVVGLLNHQSYSRHFRHEAEKMLTAVGTFKSGQLHHWRSDMLSAGSLFHENDYLSDLISSYRQNPDDGSARQALDDLFSFYSKAYDFDLFAICDENGTAIYCYPEKKVYFDEPVKGSFDESASANEIHFVDFYRSSYDQQVYLSLVVPVFDAAERSQLLAFLVLRIDPDQSLYPMITHWPAGSTTAEALLLRREGDELVALNDLRFDPDAALRLRGSIDDYPNLPAAKAAEGQEGIVEGIDYRRRPVIASLHKVEGSPWLLVARIDKEEVYAMMGPHLRNSVLIMLLLISMSAMGVLMIWRQQQTRFIAERLHTAEASDRLKTAFMNNISHEIRTPLNSILGFGQLISQFQGVDLRISSYFKIVQGSSDRLLSTINNYMDASLVASGNLVVEEKEVELVGLIRELFQESQSVFMAKGLLFELELPQGHQRILFRTDPRMLKKAIRQLIDNACKFTTEGTVSMGMTIAGEQPAFFVSDTGVGMANEFIPSLFQSFQREETGHTRNFEGSGLGLMIAKGIVERLGGNMRVASEKGEGTTVSFTLDGKLELTGSGPDDSPRGVAVREAGKPLILIVEDDSSNAYYLQVVVESLSCDNLRAANGRDGVQMVRDHPDISLVLMDLKMPEMNGYDATRLIKAIRSDLPVIAATAYAMPGDEQRARQAGCDDYLVKPIHLQTLKETLKKYNVI